MGVLRIFSPFQVDKLQAIYIIGASGRIPRLRDMIAAALPGVPVSRALNPDEAVATGCALYGAQLVEVIDASPYAPPMSSTAASVSSTGSKVAGRNRTAKANITIEQLENYVKLKWPRLSALEALMAEETERGGGFKSIP